MVVDKSAGRRLSPQRLVLLIAVVRVHAPDTGGRQPKLGLGEQAGDALVIVVKGPRRRGRASRTGSASPLARTLAPRLRSK